MTYKQNETLLLKFLGSSPVLRIVDFFLDNPLSYYSKNEIAKNLEMHQATFFKYWKELEKSGVLKVTRPVERAAMYKLNRENEITRHLIALDMVLARKAMKTAENIKGITKSR